MQPHPTGLIQLGEEGKNAKSASDRRVSYFVPFTSAFQTSPETASSFCIRHSLNNSLIAIFVIAEYTDFTKQYHALISNQV